MQRSELYEFIRDLQKRDRFLMKIADETDKYHRCLKKLGSSCAVHLSGEFRYEITMDSLLSVAAYLEDQPIHVRDYILNGLLLDPLGERSDEVNDLLEELTAPEG